MPSGGVRVGKVVATTFESASGAFEAGVVHAVGLQPVDRPFSPALHADAHEAQSEVVVHLSNGQVAVSQKRRTPTKCLVSLQISFEPPKT